MLKLKNHIIFLIPSECTCIHTLAKTLCFSACLFKTPLQNKQCLTFVLLMSLQHHCIKTMTFIRMYSCYIITLRKSKLTTYLKAQFLNTIRVLFTC